MSAFIEVLVTGDWLAWPFARQSYDHGLCGYYVTMKRMEGCSAYLGDTIHHPPSVGVGPEK